MTVITPFVLGRRQLSESPDPTDSAPSSAPSTPPGDDGEDNGDGNGNDNGDGNNGGDTPTPTPPASTQTQPTPTSRPGNDNATPSNNSEGDENGGGTRTQPETTSAVQSTPEEGTGATASSTTNTTRESSSSTRGSISTTSSSAPVATLLNGTGNGQLTSTRTFVNTFSQPSATSNISASETPSASTTGGLKAGSIIGAVAGTIFGLIIIIFAIQFALKRYRRRKEEQEAFDAAQFRSSAMIIPDSDESTFNPTSHSTTGGANGMYNGAPSPMMSQAPSSQPPVLDVNSYSQYDTTGYGYYAGVGASGHAAQSHKQDDGFYAPHDRTQPMPVAGGEMSISGGPNSPTVLANPFASEYIAPSAALPASGQTSITDGPNYNQPPSNLGPQYTQDEMMNMHRDSIGTLDDRQAAVVAGGAVGGYTIANATAPVTAAASPEDNPASHSIPDQGNVHKGSTGLARSNTTRTTASAAFDPQDAYGGM